VLSEKAERFVERRRPDVVERGRDHDRPPLS
jgi:hypothetical protein